MRLYHLLIVLVLLSGSVLALQDISTGLRIDLAANATANSTTMREYANNQNCTLTSGAVFNSSLEAIQVVNGSSYCRFPSSTLFNIGSNMNRNGTIYAWYYINADTGTNYDLFTMSAGSSAFYCYAQLSSSNNIRCDTQNSTGIGEFFSTNLQTPVGQWFMFAITINSAGLTRTYIVNQSNYLQTGNTWTPGGGVYANASGFPLLFGGSSTASPIGYLGGFRIYNITHSTEQIQAVAELGKNFENGTVNTTVNLTSIAGYVNYAEALNVHTGWPLSNVTLQYNNFSARLDLNNDGSEDTQITEAFAAKTRELFENMTVVNGTIRGEFSMESTYDSAGDLKACSTSDYASYCMQVALNYYAYTKGYHVKWQTTQMPPDLGDNSTGTCTGTAKCPPRNYANFGARVENHSRAIGCGVFILNDSTSVCEFEVWNEPDLTNFYLPLVSNRTSTAFRNNITALHKAVYDGIRGSSNAFIAAAPIWIAPMADSFDTTSVSVRRNLMSDLNAAGYNGFQAQTSHLYYGAWANTGPLYSNIFAAAMGNLSADCATYNMICTKFSFGEWNTYYPQWQNATKGSYNYSLGQTQIADAIHYLVKTPVSDPVYGNLFDFLLWNNYSSIQGEYPRWMAAVNHPQANNNWYAPAPYDILSQFSTYHAYGQPYYNCTGIDVYVDCLVSKKSNGKYYLTITNTGDADRVFLFSTPGLTLTNLQNAVNNTIYTATSNTVTLMDTYAKSTNTYLINVSDTTAPVVSVASPTNTTYNTNSVLINFSATDNLGYISSYWYNNGSTNITYTTPVTITVPNGYRTFVFYANDTAGNIGSTTVVFTVTTGISIASVAPSSNPSIRSGTTQDFSFTLNNSGNLVTNTNWFVDGTNTSSCYNSSSCTITGATTGDHTINFSTSSSVNNVTYQWILTVTTYSTREICNYGVQGSMMFSQFSSVIGGVLVVAIIVLMLLGALGIVDFTNLSVPQIAFSMIFFVAFAVLAAVIVAITSASCG